MTSNDVPDPKMTIKRSFEFELLLAVERLDGNRKLICREFQMSNPNLQYHLNKMKPLIQKTRMGRFTVLTLTDMGRTIKENLVGSRLGQLWRCHNLIVGFQIEDFGSFKFNPLKTVQMKNWTYHREVIKDSFGEWVIHIQENGLMKVYCPSIYHQNPNTAFGNMEDVSCRIVQTLRESYGMKIGLMRRIREGHKEAVGSEILGRLMKGSKSNGVWADSSTGTLRLEEEQTSDSIEKVLNLPDMIDRKLVPALEKIAERDEWLAKNLETHEKVLGGIMEAIQELRDAVKRMRK